jgi:hypothetical protein
MWEGGTISAKVGMVWETRGRWQAWSQGGNMERARGQTSTIRLKRKLILLLVVLN